MSSNPNHTMAQKTLTGFGNLVKFLPTGTVFVFQFLKPILTNNGQCHTVHKYLSSFLIASCGLSCFLSSFTDSYTDSQGKTYYGFVTRSGLWPKPTSPSTSSQDFSSYKLRFADFVHAFFSLLVFSVLALLDSDTMECFYPSFESTQKALVMVMPPVIGVICGSLFMMFPNKRHGVGYPSSDTSTPSSTSD